MKKTRRIKTVLYGDQRFSDEELDLLHTPALQRLYDLHQLGFTDRVFVDASHSRLHHVIGVVEQVGIIFDALSENLKSEGERPLRYWNPDTSIHVEEFASDWSNRVDDNLPVARLMGLLHDLTHAPFGHTLEDEIGLVEEKHDEPRRQAESFLRLSLQYLSLNLQNHGVPESKIIQPVGEPLREYLRRPDLEDPNLGLEVAGELGECWGKLLASIDDLNYEYPFQTLSRNRIIDFIVSLRKAMTGLLYLDIAHKDLWKTKTKIVPVNYYPFQALLDRFLEASGREIQPEEKFLPQRDCFMLDVIGNTICADLLDYAKRDSASAGLKLDYDAGRIVDNFTLVTEDSPMDLEVVDPDGTAISHPFRGIRVRTAIKLFGQKLRTDVPGELLNLLQVRYYVYERMLFHPTKCVVGAMLGAALQLTGLKELPNHLRYVGDQVFLFQISEAIQIVRIVLSQDDGTEQLGIEMEAREKMCSSLERCAKSGAVLTAIEILRSIEIDASLVVKKLKVLRKFPDLSRICGLITEDLIEQIKESKSPDGKRAPSFDRFSLKDYLEKFEGESAAKMSILNRICPTKGMLISNLEAAERLMRRIISRRYHKRLFRLLPNVELDTIGFRGDQPVQAIAATFLDSITRHETERRIEQECGFPVGSIVLHCPPATGPTKIAKIYVTDGATWDKAYLRDIGKIDHNIFLEHQKAVHALEEMYRSTWRLIVSVEPPLTKDWKTASRKIGGILRGVMAGGAISEIFTFANDKYMERELASAEAKLKGQEERADSDILDEGVKPKKPAEAVPKARQIAQKRMRTWGIQFHSKLRTDSDRKALDRGLEDIRKEINRSPAIVSRFPDLERTSFDDLFNDDELGLDEGELALRNQNITSRAILHWVRDFLNL